MPETVFSALVYAQLLLMAPGNMTYEALLKIFMLAYRLSCGSNIAYDKPIIYLWQAHVPNVARKRWIKNTFKNSLLLTIVRFPEKALDSHLLYHSCEAVSPPLTTLMHRLLVEHLAADAELIDFPDDGRERLIRFEDLHHHTEFVIKAICSWFQVPYHEQIIKNDFVMNVRGKKMSGARMLKRSEFRTKLLNHFDCLKIRFLLQQDYLQWGYTSFCEPDLDKSLEEYEHDRAVRTFPFAAHATLALLSNEPQAQIEKETARLEAGFLKQYNRRKNGINLVPPLYSLNLLG